MKLIKIKTEKGESVPKKALTLSEFYAIRAYFSGADYERNGILPMSMVVTSSVLWFASRFFAKMKWRI